ncbi:hypothetical protein ACI2KR_06945 [Pseudomonas luteola]
MKHQEHILAIPSSVVETQIQAGPQPFIGMFPIEFSSGDLKVAQRAGLEKDFSHRQLITYALVSSGDKYATYRRTPKGNEAGLHGAISIGFGGHVDINDVQHVNSVIDLNKTIELSMSREISEELDLNGAKVVSFEILSKKIVSNLTDVDKVHIGIIAIMKVDKEVAKSGEDQLDFMGFLSIDELKHLCSTDNVENWSKALIESL